MSWNYRLVRREVIELGEPIDWFEIRSVYYRAKNGGEDYDNIRGWSRDHHCPGGETPMEVATELQMMSAAAAKPVLDLDELERRTGQEPPHWIKALKALEGFYELDEGWDGYHGAKPLPAAIEEAISFCKTAEFGIVHMEPTLHADGSVLLEAGDDGSLGSLRFGGDSKIVYACDQDIGWIYWDRQTVPQKVREVLERVGRSQDRDAERPLEVELAKEQETS